jgi:thiosulfate/3-mercaptopyruvate sulfurtransferase
MRKKNCTLIKFLIYISFFYYSFIVPVNAQEPWTANQLMPPSELADVINSTSTHKPIVFSIGVMAVIKGSIDIGPAKEKANLEKFSKELEKLPKNADIVIYCGCCPFANCPNIRPAFKLLNELKFTNHKLLNLKTNIKVDWMNMNYPVE